MTMLNIIGWIILIIPFIVIFVYMVKDIGLKGSLIIIGLISIVTSIMWLGAYLITL